MYNVLTMILAPSVRKKAIFCPNLLANGCWVKWPASTYIRLALSASKFPKPVSRVPTFCIGVQHFLLLETWLKWDSIVVSLFGSMIGRVVFVLQQWERVRWKSWHVFLYFVSALSLEAFQKVERSLFSWNRNTIWQFISVIFLFSWTLRNYWYQLSWMCGWRHPTPSESDDMEQREVKDWAQ